MWNRHVIESTKDVESMLHQFRQSNPTIAGFDTETTGLHIIKDKPFLMVFGFDKHVYTCDLETDRYLAHHFLDAMYHCGSKVDYLFAHNTTYDLHMMYNYGKPYPHRNLADNTTLVRLTQLADDPTQNITALKVIAKRYVSKTADQDQKFVKEDLTRLKAQRTAVLKALLKPVGWTKKKVDDFLKDKTNLLEDLPQEIREIFMAWENDYPEPTYADVNREIMTVYASRDVELMLDFVEMAMPVVHSREQMPVFERECRLIPHLFKMERVGFNVNRDYLFTCKENTRQYLLQKRQELCDLAGQPLTCGQHQTIKKIYFEQYGIEMPSCDEANLNLVLKAEIDERGKDLARLIMHLRTVEKWYSTYICGMIKKTDFDGRLYTQSNASGAVSGRFSSDFQQMPKDSLKSTDGTVLFNPREAIMPTGNGYKSIFYFDYSQIELRIQAHYTIMISGGDMNLCRAYMPFQCYSKETGEDFDYDNPEHLARWGTGEWLHKEDDQAWHKVDLHSATTKQAFPDLDPESDEFKKMRKYGKSTNFAKNYGAGKMALINQFHFPEDIAEALDKGYYEAFPKVRDYQEAVAKISALRGYVQNLYGRRYYLKDQRWAYKLCNYLIQGSGADMLKEMIINICERMEELGLKTRFQMNIHDELSFEVYEGEEWFLPEIKAIMEVAPWSKIPIVADVERTETTWSEKYEVEITEVYDEWYERTYGEKPIF